MYLKSLELQGFKSFPDKTVIRFSDGMTAIVGPNGSGKSNISDAIRWVLGEQSTKSLRGAKMEDVIFGGTAKRSPTGFAQVSLLLDNSTGQFPIEATEVMVTRKYYRSGESEYFLNRKRVRLRDVREVFMDTGLGHDGYSIIGQGRIDEILSVRSEDRREVFEEAAGVTRFRTRKEEAERKLSQTAENLVRIRDIWSELDARSGPLAKQAESAKQFMVLRDELRLHEVSLWMHTLEGMKGMRSKSEADRKQAEQEMEQAKTAQKTCYERAEQIAEDMRGCDRKMEQLQQDLRTAEETAAAMARRAAVLEESRRNAEENLAITKGQLAAQEEQQSLLHGQMEARETRLREAEQELTQASAVLEQLQEQMEALARQIEDGQEKTIRLRKQADSAGERVFAVQAEQRAAQQQLKAMQERRADVQTDLQAAQQSAEREELAQQEMQNQLKQLQNTIREQENALQTHLEQGHQLRHQLQRLRQENLSRNAALMDSRNRIRMLTELQKDYEGFSRAVKLVMQMSAKGQLRGIRGPLSSLIQVSDTYVTAIETALGAAASNIITECAENGRDAIALLKKRDGGRATFLPMDTIRPQYLKETGLERCQGFCGIAADLVECEADYRDIIENALGRTVIADQMDNALAMSRAFRNRFRIVTLDGQVINAGGSMTGGSIGRSSGILSRANQLEKIKQKAAQQEKELTESKRQETELTERAARQEERFASMQKDLEEQRRQLAALEAQTRQHELLLDNIRGAQKQLQEEHFSEQKRQEELKARIGRLERETAELARERQQTLTALNRAAGEAEEAAQHMTKLTEQISEQRTHLAQAATERETLGQALMDLRGMEEAACQTAAEHRQRMIEYQTVIQQAQAELSGLTQDTEHSHQHTDAMRQTLRQYSGERMQLEQSRTQTEKKARDMNTEIIRLERKYKDAEHTAQRIRGEEQQLLDRMWDSYELTPTAAKNIIHPIVNRQEEEKKASELRRRIKALGPVNPAAVKEYEELRERLTFLTEQKTDLEQAEAELRGIIDKLTLQMQEIFAQSFALLNRHFGETFAEIFGGGSAELRLEDESNILTSGIEIRVAPPGKTVKSLSLLSGGEKAFVAIALYFAILKVRPTPFCVLDEIEAALDDVNVTRYAKYLQRLSDKTQFIVITHRRGTMEEADMLYGVTMQERGVSKLLMLNISEVEKELKLELK